MTDEKLNENRLEIIKEYLTTGEILNLAGDLDMCISSSQPGIYHVFFDRQSKNITKNNNLTHQYSMGNIGLKNLADSLELNTIKRIYIESKYLKLRNKKILENSINPLDLENYK